MKKLYDTEFSPENIKDIWLASPYPDGVPPMIGNDNHGSRMNYTGELDAEIIRHDIQFTVGVLLRDRQISTSPSEEKPD